MHKKKVIGADGNIGRIKGCMFCGRKKLSKEHLFAKWLLDYYKDRVPGSGITNHRVNEMSREREEIVLTDSGVDASNKIAEGPFSRRHHPLLLTTKVVCAECNNGWMSRIEEDMKNVFFSVFVNSSGNLTKNQGLSVAKWATLKKMLHERAYLPRYWSSIPVSYGLHQIGITQQLEFRIVDRWRKFYTDQNIPSEFTVFATRTNDISTTAGDWNYIPQAEIKENEIKIHSIIGLYLGAMSIVVTTNPADITILEKNSSPPASLTVCVRAWPYKDGIPLSRTGGAWVKWVDNCVVEAAQKTHKRIVSLGANDHNKFPIRRNYLR